MAFSNGNCSEEYRRYTTDADGTGGIVHVSESLWVCGRIDGTVCIDAEFVDTPTVLCVLLQGFWAY